MHRDEVLAKLRSMEPSLRGQGVSGLYLFGSVARDEATSESDVDVAFDIAPGAEFDAWDQGRILMDLADALRRPVDLVERRVLLARIDGDLGNELVQIF